LGAPTVTGSAKDWPFHYQGMEKEFADDAEYYTGSGQFYSPQMVRSLSEVGQTGTSGAGGGPSGMAIPLPSGSSGGLSPQSVENDTQQAFQVGTDIYNAFKWLNRYLGSEAQLPALPLAIIGGAVDFLVNFFEDIFGGGSSPTIPRQLLHKRHPLYPVILGVQDGLIPDEASAGLEVCGDPQPSKKRPLSKEPQYQKPGSSPGGGLTPGQYDRFAGNIESLTVGGAAVGCGCGAAAGSFFAAVGAGPGCVGGAAIGALGGVYLDYLAASRGTLPHPQEDLPPPQSGLP
jgi:hypothetical protein